MSTSRTIEHTTDASRIVVGVSESPTGRAALNVAIDIAVHEGQPLSLIRVWRDVGWFLSARADELYGLVSEQHTEQSRFARVCADATYRAPGIEVTGEFVSGDLYSKLLERSTGAALLVLGADGASDKPGSVTRWFIEHAVCPVIVVDAGERIVEYHAGNACGPPVHVAS